MVEDLLAARGVIVSHQTVRLWAEKFGSTFANEIRCRSSGRFGDKWHLDEAVISIRGKKHWLWRAVERRVLAPGVQLISEPHVHPFFRANLYHVEGTDADLVIDFRTGVRSLRDFLDIEVGSQ